MFITIGVYKWRRHIMVSQREICKIRVTGRPFSKFSAYCQHRPAVRRCSVFADSGIFFWPHKIRFTMLRLLNRTLSQTTIIHSPSFAFRSSLRTMATANTPDFVCNAASVDSGVNIPLVFRTGYCTSPLQRSIQTSRTLSIRKLGGNLLVWNSLPQR